MSRRTLGVVLALYLSVVGFGVFGPSPGDQLEQAGEELRKVEDEVRSRAPGGTADTPAGSLESDRWMSWRSPSLDDIGWNSLGAVMGFGLWLAGSWAWRRLRDARGPSPHH